MFWINAALTATASIKWIHYSSVLVHLMTQVILEVYVTQAAPVSVSEHYIITAETERESECEREEE